MIFCHRNETLFSVCVCRTEMNGWDSCRKPATAFTNDFDGIRAAIHRNSKQKYLFLLINCIQLVYGCGRMAVRREGRGAGTRLSNNSLSFLWIVNCLMKFVFQLRMLLLKSLFCASFENFAPNLMDDRGRCTISNDLVYKLRTARVPWAWALRTFR